MAALLGSAVEPYSATHPVVYAGTYAVRICHGSCTGASATAFRTGIIVLFDEPLLQDQNGSTFRRHLDSDPSNACFVLNHTAVSTDQDSYIPLHGFFSWALQEHAVALELERSPDGGYGVRLHLSPKGLAGTGAIWGGVPPPQPMAPDSPQPPSDTVSAVRMGEPDIAKCPPLSEFNR
ncbi:MAG TPA: hypothetical protein VIJ37_06395 [Steroidobacteraceae bacterium]